MYQPSLSRQDVQTSAAAAATAGCEAAADDEGDDVADTQHRTLMRARSNICRRLTIQRYTPPQ